jgi:hypothetical protein
MQLFGRGLFWKLLIAAAISMGINSGAQAACRLTPPPRFIIKVGHYGGAETKESQEELGRFFDILRQKFDVLKEDLRVLAADAAFLGQLSLQLKKVEVLAGDAISDEDAHRYWILFNDTLELVYGTLFHNDNSYSVRTRIHFGELPPSGFPAVVSLTLPLQHSEVPAINDTYSLIIHYGLALEAQQLQCPANVISSLLAIAHEKADDLLKRDLEPSDRTHITAIKKAISSTMPGF